MMSTKGHDRLNINTQHVPLRQNAEEKVLEKELRKLINQSRCSTVIMQEQEPNEVIIQASCSVHYQRNESLGPGDSSRRFDNAEF